jgi:hypothetical protein
MRTQKYRFVQDPTSCYLPQGDYQASRKPLGSVTWGAGNQLNEFIGTLQASDVPASTITPPPAAWQQQLYGSNAAAEAPQAAGLGMPQYGLTPELLLFQQQQQLLMATSQPLAAVLQQAHEPRLSLNMGLPVEQQQFQQLQPQMYAQLQQQQQQQQQWQQQQQQYQQLPEMESVVAQQQQQHQSQLPVQLQSHQQFQQMQPQQYLQPQQQQQQYQLLSAVPHHAVTTCGPAALGIGLPAFGSMPPAEQLLQSPQQALPMPAADVCFSSARPAAAAGGAAGGGAGADMCNKSRSSSSKRSTQISAATGKPLSKSGDASRRYR